MDKVVIRCFAGRGASKRGQSPRRCLRRLRCEILETRQLLTGNLGEGEVDEFGAVPDAGADPAEETLLFAFGEDSPLAFGVLAANMDNPAVAQVEISPTPVQSLAVVFSDEVNAAALIGNSTIVSAVSLVHLSSGPVSIQATQFAYDPALRKLTLSLAQPLAAGAYELRIDGSKIQNPAGGLLLGGREGLSFAIPSFAAPATIQAAGADLTVDGYSVPSLADWNNDGLADLVVGEKTTAGTGKVRVYLNLGSNAEPVYGTFVFAQGADGDLSVPASGCQGVFPRVFDWNQDGKPDLVWGLADGTLHVTLNENTAAQPRFGPPQVVQVGPPDAKQPSDVGDRMTFDLVDWNNDDRVDLVLGGLDGRVHVFWNEATAGPPDFRTDTILLDGANPLTVASGRASVTMVDLNDDGRKDLVLGNTEGQLVFYPNVGTDAAPSFDGSQLLEADGAVIDLAGIPRSRPFAADVNGDGVADLLVGAGDGLVRQYLGSRAVDGGAGEPGGSYVFGFRVEPAPTTNPWQCPVFPLDVNHDGLITPLDVLIVINFLNANGPAALPLLPPAALAPPPYLDCSGDRNVTALDALVVINDLEAHGPRAVPVASGTSCEDLPVCQAAGESSDLEAALDDLASDVWQAGSL